MRINAFSDNKVLTLVFLFNIRFSRDFDTVLRQGYIDLVFSYARQLSMYHKPVSLINQIHSCLTDRNNRFKTYPIPWKSYTFNEIPAEIIHQIFKSRQNMNCGNVFGRNVFSNGLN